MSYVPPVDHDINTTETALEETVGGKLVYRILIKQSGNLTQGATTNIAHGVTFDKVTRVHMTIKRSDGSSISYPWNSRTVSSTFHLGVRVDATNIQLVLGAGWTGAGNVLSDAWIQFEYTK